MQLIGVDGSIAALVRVKQRTATLERVVEGSDAREALERLRPSRTTCVSFALGPHAYTTHVTRVAAAIPHRLDREKAIITHDIINHAFPPLPRRINAARTAPTEIYAVISASEAVDALCAVWPDARVIPAGEAWHAIGFDAVLDCRDDRVLALYLQTPQKAARVTRMDVTADAATIATEAVRAARAQANAVIATSIAYIGRNAALAPIVAALNAIDVQTAPVTIAGHTAPSWGLAFAAAIAGATTV